MTHYDFIDTIVAAYAFLWRNRHVVLVMAFIPFLIKLACLITIFALGMETQYLRQGLVALPAYFAEGVLFAKLIVMAGKNGETLGPAPSSDNRGIMAATLLYVLIKITLAFGGGMGMMFVMENQADMAANESEASMPMFFAAMFLLGMMIWGFRLTWLYIPLAQGYGIKSLLHRIRGLPASFILIGTWMVCFIPLVLVMIMITGVAAGILGHTEETPSSLYHFVFIMVQAGFDILAGLLSTLAISFGFHTIMATPDKKGGRV